MLEYIHMKNFQKHEDKRLVFSENVTYITGANNAGKSCTLRALQWVAMNNGNSKQFRRTYEEDGVLKTTTETSVEVGVDGHVVKRVLTSSKNEYYLDDVKLTGFGRGTPKEVSDLFGMTELNVSAQFSPLFLVGDSGGAVAEALAKIASLEEMDALTDTINRDVRTIQDRLVRNKETFQNGEDVLSVLGTGLSELEDTLSVVGSVECSISNIDLDVYPVQELYVSLQKCPDTTLVKDAVSSLSRFLLSDSDFQFADYSELEFLVKNYKPEVTVSPELRAYHISLIDVLQHDEKESECLSILSKLEDLNSAYNSTKSQIVTIYNELLEYKSCPLCGSMLEEYTHE